MDKLSLPLTDVVGVCPCEQEVRGNQAKITEYTLLDGPIVWHEGCYQKKQRELRGQ